METACSRCGTRVRDAFTARGFGMRSRHAGSGCVHCARFGMCKRHAVRSPRQKPRALPNPPCPVPRAQSPVPSPPCPVP
eukprot:6744049-Prymnesium_polylepis.1